MTQELITMSQKELSRYEVIRDLIIGKINGTQAAQKIRLSVRQVKRLKAKVKRSGTRGLIHGNRGRESNRKIDEEIIRQAKNLLRKKYSDFGPTFAAEKLEENHQLKLSAEKVRQLMTTEKLWKPKARKKNKEHRYWRERKEHFGELEQFDGSYEDWFEGRAPEPCLLASIDDATGEITQAQFTSDEGVVPVFSFWQAYVSKHGKPLKIYLDKHSTYKINTKHLLDDPRALTQFERAMKDLDIEVIHAHSCQAKGRIERLFGTLQDRLTKELRLANISTIKEANKFLERFFIPKFNAGFAVVPSSQVNFHKALTKKEKENLEKIFSQQDTRVVNNDFTISYESKWYQLDKTQPALVCRKDKVEVEKRLDGKISISLRGKHLNFTELPERPKKVKMKVKFLTKTEPDWKPPIDHPWRKPFIFSYQYTHQPKVEKVPA